MLRAHDHPEGHVATEAHTANYRAQPRAAGHAIACGRVAETARRVRSSRIGQLPREVRDGCKSVALRPHHCRAAFGLHPSGYTSPLARYLDGTAG